MKLIAVIVRPKPLDQIDIVNLMEARQRGTVIAIVVPSFESPLTQARLLELKLADAAIVPRRLEPEIVARLMDADEVRTV